MSRTGTNQEEVKGGVFSVATLCVPYHVPLKNPQKKLEAQKMENKIESENTNHTSFPSSSRCRYG